jgi:prephenate dehydratase
MSRTIAYLGPVGTYSETAAMVYLQSLERGDAKLIPYPSIALTLRSLVKGETDLAIVPVENSTEGSVVMTLDALWELNGLQIQKELVLPIVCALLSPGNALVEITEVYSHPQPLGQCQKWLEKHLPTVTIIPTNSTTEAIQRLEGRGNAAAIAAPRAAELYGMPILVEPINDYAGNCTRFWVMGATANLEGDRVSLAFQVKDMPGALMNPLKVFAERGLNLSRIESRPTKRSLGEYVFFIDVEIPSERGNLVAPALAELATYTDELKVFGYYPVV